MASASRLKSPPDPDAPERYMGAASWVTEDLGLAVLTVLVSGLTAYLVYAMLHPERI